MQRISAQDMDLMIFTGKHEHFFGKTIQLLQGFQLKSRFFFEINQQLYTSAYCKALDAFWTIISWALELCLSQWFQLTTTTTGIASFGSVSIDATTLSQMGKQISHSWRTS